MLNEFEEYIKGNFWTLLISKMQNYDIQSQVRLAECLADVNNKYSVKILIILTQTENSNLLITCIDSLRDANFSLLTVEEKHNVSINAKKVLISCSEMEKKVIRNFLNKIQSSQ